MLTQSLSSPLRVVIVGLRLVCRATFSRGTFGRLGLDDLITFICLVILIISCAFSSIGISYGLGQHEKNLDEYNLKEAIKWNVIINAVLIWSFSLPKFAIVAILKRILDYGTKTTILFWSLALTSQACFLATSVWWFAQCTPVAYQWDRSIGGTCASTDVLTKLAFATSAFSAFLDLFFALYPVPFIMRLNMPLRNRIAVCFAFGLSAIACAVSIYKLAVFDSVFELLATDRTCECQLNERGERVIVWRENASPSEKTYANLDTLQIQFPILIYLVLPRGPCSSSAHHYPHWVLCSESSSVKSRRTQVTIVRLIRRAIAVRTILEPIATAGCTSGATTHSTKRRISQRRGCTPALMISPSFPQRNQSRDIVKIPTQKERPSINWRGSKRPPQNAGPGIVLTII